MIVPQFWAEERIRYRSGKKQITVCRFGWSDVSQDDAQANAAARAKEAFARVASGEKLPRRERKVAYNGADGVPIREEILRREGDTVITRNSYGAHCLNTPNVLFADVDFQNPTPTRLACSLLLIGLAAGIARGWMTHSAKTGILTAVVALVAASVAARILHRAWTAISGGVENIARKRIEKFAATHGDWRLRIYRTPAGFRVLAMHRTFDPNEQAVAEFFTALGTDPIYARMCKNQNCFRARVSPKPWRIGISQHMRPRPGVWPIASEKMPERLQWIGEYEKKAGGYASCHFISEVGNGAFHESAVAVQRLHDTLSRADVSLPLA